MEEASEIEIKVHGGVMNFLKEKPNQKFVVEDLLVKLKSLKKIDILLD